MKICFVSYEYEPFPGGGIATYHNAAVKALSAAGHEVHVVTNRAFHGRSEPRMTRRYWREGNLTIHRLRYFNEKRHPHADAQFFDINTGEYTHKERLWAREPSNLAAHQAASYIEALHAEVGLDVIEVPEFFAEAFYVLRRRMSGDRHAFPPVCLHGHISSRIAFGVNHHVWELGWRPHRHMMLREEYGLRHADALITPSRALMARYEADMGDDLPEIRATIPYYLELPEEVSTPPKGLDDGSPYLALIGRVEPRKGPDLAMAAFGLLADDYPDLKLVLIGKEMWHQGESVDDVIASRVPAQHRGRVVRLGQIPRAQALATARDATAFLHPAPWDNYPCATLEAMAVGATCIVSDSGGQSEMVEDGNSGLVFPAGDAAALAAAARRVLDDRALKEKLAKNAVTRLRKITDPDTLTAKKLEVFEAMVKREKDDSGDPLGPYREPAFVQQNAGLPELPGSGLVVLDAAGAKPDIFAASRDGLWKETQSSAERWKLCALLDPGEDRELPAPWTRASSIEPAPWVGLPPDDIVVFVTAGTRFDLGHLRNVVAQVADAPVDCGSFAWLRPPTPRVFPYPSDFSVHDLLLIGQVLPPAFAVRARHLQSCTSFAGLRKAEQRLCSLLAGSAAAGDLVHQHVGKVCGDYYGELAQVNEDTQLRAIGYLEILGLLPASSVAFGSTLVHETSTPDQENKQQKQGNGKPQAKSEPKPAPLQRHAPSDNGRMQELEEVYRQHMALKQMAPVRWMRKLGVFGLARKLFPKSKGMIGPG